MCSFIKLHGFTLLSKAIQVYLFKPLHFKAFTTYVNCIVSDLHCICIQILLQQRLIISTVVKVALAYCTSRQNSLSEPLVAMASPHHIKDFLIIRESLKLNTKSTYDIRKLCTKNTNNKTYKITITQQENTDKKWHRHQCNQL